MALAEWASFTRLAIRHVLTWILNREFHPTKNGIFYATRPDAKRPVSYEIRYQAFATGASQTLYRFDSLGITQGLSVSPDEKTITSARSARLKKPT